jgi:hypothetical protein
VIDKQPRLLQGYGIILAKQPDETDEMAVRPNPVRPIYEHPGT